MNNLFADTVKKKTSEELLTMVYKFEEWNCDMLQAIEKELLERNILPNDIAIRKQEIIDKETTD